MRLPRLLLIALLILVPAFMRAIHFERSIVPMGALALFCGAHFRNRWLALGIPLASMLGGDVLIGLFHHDMRFGFHFLMPVIYGCYALNVLMGMGLQHGIGTGSSRCTRHAERRIRSAAIRTKSPRSSPRASCPSRPRRWPKR